jgi:DNA-binding MarR family transcriptional regulator
MSESPVPQVTDEQYQRLLELRTGLRRFLAWSEAQAKAQGVTPAQHQLLLAVRGHRGGHPPTVGEIAEHLLLRPHSAGELVDRAAAAGLVERHSDERDSRVVRIVLTEEGARRLGALSAAHHEELARLAPQLRALSEGLGDAD